MKDGSRIQYYGGKSQQQEKSTRVKARVKAHAMRELMETKDRILIMGHKLSDSDAFGSAIGIYRIATALNKKAHVVINEVTTSVQPMMARFGQSGLSGGSVPDRSPGGRAGRQQYHAGCGG